MLDFEREGESQTQFAVIGGLESGRNHFDCVDCHHALLDVEVVEEYQRIVFDLCPRRFGVEDCDVVGFVEQSDRDSILDKAPIYPFGSYGGRGVDPRSWAG